MFVVQTGARRPLEILVSFEFFTDLLRSRHSDHPQRGYAAQAALSAIYEGINELAKLGHSFQLIEGVKAEAKEYPKTLYHESELPIQVDSREEEDKAGENGFVPHPSTTPTPSEASPKPLPPVVEMQIPMPKGEYAPGSIGVHQSLPPGASPETGTPVVSALPSEDSGNPRAEAGPEATPVGASPTVDPTEREAGRATPPLALSWPHWYRNTANPSESHREIHSIEEAGSLGPEWEPV